MNAVPWYIAITIVGIFASVTSSVALLYLRNIRDDMKLFSGRLDRHDDDIKSLNTQLATYKTDCQGNFVDKVDYIRQVNKQEKTLDELVKMICDLQGSMKFVEQMPKICGSIARDIIKEMNQ